MADLLILVADDHAAVRRSIRSLIESHPQWRVCGEAINGLEAVEEARRLKPGLVLLDMTMPELDGLEATRRILKDSPETNVLILTMHQSEALAEEARRAGAKGTILKSNADHTLAAAIDSLTSAAIHLANSIVGRFRHIAAFFQSRAEEDSVLQPFFAEGLKQDDKAVHIIEPPSRAQHIARLQEAGIDADETIKRGQLELLSWGRMYLADGHFDQDAMLERIRSALAAGSEQGYARTRLVGHMEWALEDAPGVRDLVEYETRLNDFPHKGDDVIVCAYDLARFSAGVIVDVIRSHPAVVMGGALQDNPFYVPSDLLLAELRRRARNASA
jgi:DNA-binding NarL/FixJ family response regulator